MIVARMTLEIFAAHRVYCFIDSLVHIQLYHYNHNQQEEKTSVAAVLDTVHKVVKQFSFIILQNRRWMICIKEDYGLVMNMCLVYLMELTLCMFLARMILFMLQQQIIKT